MRKRFTKQEREAFTPGTAVEWRNGGHWHPGTVTGEITTGDGWQSVCVVHRGATTRTVSYGARIHGGPTFVRMPESEATS
jgi:hypothetical protein